ncbi:MAG TPA: sodium-translocating pyrophosphatase [Candidatus Omnitrophota bacterium]|nr:sodium-translocating pyrophosphatase [Candidatus Omnitrophota bacterium]HPD84408.1 sodium-translocating pyrophosphatase [Candidatus Omnitrophota bacterium]HRZ03266.1 sodium-translocating pyrophosphatase [Candidatus Omnitrophota bacterium]
MKDKIVMAGKSFIRYILGTFILLTCVRPAFAGEADLIVPDLSSVSFLNIDGRTLLLWGMSICAFGFIFGFVQFLQIKAIKVHKSMFDISELIYETCKTYLITQGKFLIILEILIGVIITVYFGWLRHFTADKVVTVLIASVVGIAGSYAVAWFGMRINTMANSRSAFGSLGGKPFPTYDIPLKAGMSIGMLLISTELFVMLCILLFIDPNYAGPCFIGFAIGESLGASVLRMAGGIFTKIADIGSDLMKIVFNIKEDDARNPGVIADCTGDNAGDSVGPTADGFETYGVTGVALITFILLAIHDPVVQVQLLVWIFVMRLVMIIASGVSYGINSVIAKARYGNAKEMNFEVPLTSLVWITSFVSIGFTYLASYLLIANLGDGTLWWKLASIITCGTIAGAVIPELVKVFTSTESSFVQNILNSSRKGGASLNILAGLTAGNFSAYWLGFAILVLMGIAYGVSTLGLGAIMLAPAVFALGLVAFGFLGMGPVTIAVDSYGPVADNAQSIYELSLIENIPGIREEIKRDFGFDPDFKNAKDYLEANDGAGNTFKATTKPVLIGTAVVGATTMIFSIIFILTGGLTSQIDKLSILHPPFLLGLVAGGMVIYWFTGASIQAVTAGAYHAVEFIKNNIKLEGSEKASMADSKKVVEICTKFAQKGMINIFLTIFFSTLAFACLDSFFFIGYLISIALFGLFQAIFMANAGGAWDNCKKLVETKFKDQKGTPLHAATIVGDTVGDPFKDTSSVAMNPIIKFTTLFGLLAIEMAIELSQRLNLILAVVFFAVSVFFVLRSFYDMRIRTEEPA